MSALERRDEVVGQRRVEVIRNHQLALHGANSPAFGFSNRDKLRHRSPMLGDGDDLPAAASSTSFDSVFWLRPTAL